jgi:Fe-S-cluster containining protein
MNRNERRLAEKEAKQSVAAGLDPSGLNPQVMVELVQQIFKRLEQSKRSKSIDAPVDYLLSKIDLTLGGMYDVPAACSKGCSHCCNIWVSVTAPEVLYIAKRIQTDAKLRVGEAHQATGQFSHADRPQHPFPCPHLRDNLCSIYEHRPLFCRLAASGDADICRRSYSNETDEFIPTPAMFIFGREAYSTALAVALGGASLPHLCYEFNSALQRAITTPDAEARWLAGEDIFSGVLSEGSDPLDSIPNRYLYQMAFAR